MNPYDTETNEQVQIKLAQAEIIRDLEKQLSYLREENDRLSKSCNEYPKLVSTLTWISDKLSNEHSADVDDAAQIISEIRSALKNG